jgi:hypothetical protein
MLRLKTKQSPKRPTKQSTKQSPKQSTKQSTKQSPKQSTKQSTEVMQTGDMTMSGMQSLNILGL